MDAKQLRRTAAVTEDLDATRTGSIPARWTGASSPRSQPESPVDRRAERIAAAERTLAEAYAGLRAAGCDPDTINTAFAIARDCLAEAREFSAQTRRELALAEYERNQAHRMRMDSAAPPVIPDMPGLDLCPDPSDARTDTEFMDTLRKFRIWAGKPSYRVMERQCARRFAASTICTALRGNEMPGLDMVQAIIVACGGREEHRHAFATAWRRLMMPQQEADRSATRPRRARTLYPVGETA